VDLSESVYFGFLLPVCVWRAHRLRHRRLSTWLLLDSRWLSREAQRLRPERNPAHEPVQQLASAPRLKTLILRREKKNMSFLSQIFQSVRSHFSKTPAQKACDVAQNEDNLILLGSGGFARVFGFDGDKNPELKTWVVRKVKPPTGPRKRDQENPHKDEMERQKRLILDFQTLTCPTDQETICQKFLKSAACDSGDMVQTPRGMSWEDWFCQKRPPLYAPNFCQQIWEITAHLQKQGVLLTDFKLENTIIVDADSRDWRVVAIDTDSWFQRRPQQPPRKLQYEEIYITTTERHWLPPRALLTTEFTDAIFDLWLFFLSLTCCSNFIFVEQSLDMIYKHLEVKDRIGVFYSRLSCDGYFILSPQVFALWQFYNRTVDNERVAKWKRSSRSEPQKARQQEVQELYSRLHIELSREEGQGAPGLRAERREGDYRRLADEINRYVQTLPRRLELGLEKPQVSRKRRRLSSRPQRRTQARRLSWGRV
jgi:hypothetical protein